MNLGLPSIGPLNIKMLSLAVECTGLRLPCAFCRSETYVSRLSGNSGRSTLLSKSLASGGVLLLEES